MATPRAKEQVADSGTREAEVKGDRRNLVHPCVLIASKRDMGADIWLCSDVALNYEESLKWIKNEFRAPTDPSRAFKLMTRAEAWNPINWTISPFTHYVWLPKS
jgi:hypothetical protein